MAENFPGPYELRFFYTTDGTVHQMNLSCNVKYGPAPGDLPGTIAVELRDGSDDYMSNICSAWATLIEPLFSAMDATLDRAELWQYTAGTYDAAYISTYAIGEAGSSASATKPAGQDIMTLRTTEGGILKLYFLGTTYASAARKTYADSPDDVQDIFDFLTSDSNWVLARDTSYPVAPLYWLAGESEAIFKKLYR